MISHLMREVLELEDYLLVISITMALLKLFLMKYKDILSQKMLFGSLKMIYLKLSKG